MKIINKIIILCLLAVLAYSCIEDEGNYDYTPLSFVTISNVYSNWGVPLGEEYTITPEIDYNGLEEDDFNYYWITYIQNDDWGDTISYEKDLHYKFLRTQWYMTSLVVEHKESKGITTKQIDLNIVPRYQTGWVILSDKNGESELSYARREESTIDGVTYPYRAFPDIFTQQNGTEEQLGTGPVSLGRHFTSSEDQILVVQGGEQTAEISGTDFTKVITTREEFVGSVYPAGFVPVSAEYGERIEVILGANGKLYTRINPNNSFQVCSYSNIPIPGVDIKKMYYTANLGFIHLYDELNHRIMGIQDLPQAFTGRILYTKMDPEGNNAADFTPLDNLGDDSKLEFCSSYSIGSTRYYIQILKKGAAYYFQTFELSQSNEILYVQNGVQSLFKANGLVNDDSKYCVIRDSYLYFSAGNKLYYWDRQTDQIATYYDFPEGANIVKIEPNDAKNELGIGLDNGEFYIMDISYDAMVGSTSKILLPMKGLGKVVDVQYKYGNTGNFNNQQQ